MAEKRPAAGGGQRRRRQHGTFVRADPSSGRRRLSAGGVPCAARPSGRKHPVGSTPDRRTLRPLECTLHCPGGRAYGGYEHPGHGNAGPGKAAGAISPVDGRAFRRRAADGSSPGRSGRDRADAPAAGRGRKGPERDRAADGLRPGSAAAPPAGIVQSRAGSRAPGGKHSLPAR